MIANVLVFWYLLAACFGISWLSDDCMLLSVCLLKATDLEGVLPKLSLRVWAVGPLGRSSTGVMLGVK